MEVFHYVLFCSMLHIIVLHLLSHVSCTVRNNLFEKFENQEPVFKNVITTFATRRIMHCALLCSKTTDCKSFLFADMSSECQLLDTVIVNESELTTSTFMFARLTTSTLPQIVTTTDPLITLNPFTTQASTSPTPTVIDIAYGVSRMCLDPMGYNDDVLVLTTAGVYVYEDIHQLTVAPCDGPLEFTSVFQGFPSMPTSVNNVRGLLHVHSNEIELYADNDIVYKWKGEPGALLPLSENTYTNVLGGSDFNGLDTQCFVSTAFFGGQLLRFGCLGYDRVCFILYGTMYCVQKDDEVRIDGVDVNLLNIINVDINVIGVEVIGNTDPLFVFVDINGHVYHGTMDDNSTSTPTGTIQFN